MALVNPCASDDELFNTGSECNDAMDVTYTLYLVPLKDRWTSTDIAGPAGYTNFVESRTLAAPALRWLPFGGSSTEIGDIIEANVADVIETLPNGVQYRVKQGQFARTLKTAKGGLCLAKALFGNNWSKYGFVEVDKAGKVLQVDHGTDDTTQVTTYGPVPLSNAYAPLPELASFTTVYKNLFFISFDPLYYVQRSIILKGDRTEAIQDVPGLLDVIVAPSPTTTQTTTTIFVTVKTECAETDLIAEYPGTTDPGLIQLVNFVLTNEDGTTNTPSAIAVVGGEIRFTGTFTTGTNITVALATPVILAANGVSGYEGIKAATVAIP